MTENALYTAVVLALIGVFLVVPTWIKLHLQDRRARQKLESAVAEGRHEPPTIRPWLDPGRCMGSGACVTACPEHVLQVIDGQMRVVDGAKCVGHGACVAACPTVAIELVFGSERRGIEIPAVGPDFQTNVPGIYIAGELGGMGLIANAVEQGAQALANAARGLPATPDGGFDVVVVGAGPAGLAAALAARQQGLRYALLDQEAFGGALRHFPRQKIVMTRPMELPGFGRVKLSTTRKEALIELFEEVVAKTGLEISAPERVDAVARDGAGFVVTTDRRTLRASRVILAVGRRGTPRRLEVPGEDGEKVAYRLVDAELYQHQHLLVVGGGDSAIEAACDLADQPGNRVTLSYRGKELSRPKAANVERLRSATDSGRLTLLLESKVKKIGVDRVWVDQGDAEQVLPNDFVFVFAGGILPTAFLQKAGIDVATHHGKRVVPA